MREDMEEVLFTLLIVRGLQSVAKAVMLLVARHKQQTTITHHIPLA